MTTPFQRADRELRAMCPQTLGRVDHRAWRVAVAEVCGGRWRDSFPDALGRLAGLPYAGDLARLELLLHGASTAPAPDPEGVAELAVNPTVQIVPVPWSGLAGLLAGEDTAPVAGEELVLCWKPPGTSRARWRLATESDLLALKLVVEDLDPRQVAAAQGVAPALLEGVRRRAQGDGLLLAPPSRLRRDPDRYPARPGMDPGYHVAQSFTLQWHVTHACDLHCRHCYDRSRRSALTLEQGLRLLDDLYEFCRRRRVAGQVTFTGGNPLLLPDFEALYRGAAERDFLPAILGNPAPREDVARLVAIEPPDFYQVSLEGLRDHNDHIRGAGHFDRVMEFLPVLRELGVHAMVMLTLTRDNQDQVLPLAEQLRGRADTFHFNRLSPVGEGADLAVPERDGYRGFLAAYLDAAAHNPVMGIKDNLFNVLLRERGRDSSGGCTGHGCGAAFNFLSVLPDGETHACRKFPSAVGNVLEQGLAGVYDGEPARRYRQGTRACLACPLKPVCGGCMASVRGSGGDPLRDPDPYCFLAGR